MTQDSPNDFNRRDFLKGTSIAALMAMMGGVELRAQEAKPANTNDIPLTVIPAGPTVNYGIIGLGPRGREIAGELGKLPNAPVVALCDTYATSLRRGGELAPKAQKFDDYTKLLENKDVKAVVIATPTHQHKTIVLDSLKAGKHVYCEAPLAHTIDEARQIAAAAKASVKSFFQSGLQNRTHPDRRFVEKDFFRTGTLGNNIQARAQYHQKTSWSFESPNEERKNAINWRLQKEISTGLMGEIAIHQLDMISWLTKSRPKAITGLGAILEYKDKREVPDTVQALIEYPNGFTLAYDASLATSFDGEYEIIYGDMATVMMRGSRAWMFKEADSPLLGWEVYAMTEKFLGETGIVLRADASKQKTLIQGADHTDPNTPLSYALQAFTLNVGMVDAAVQDYVSNFGDSDLASLSSQLVALKTTPVPGWKEGFEATVAAIKANEAVTSGSRVTLADDLFNV